MVTKPIYVLIIPHSGETFTHEKLLLTDWALQNCSRFSGQCTWANTNHGSRGGTQIGLFWYMKWEFTVFVIFAYVLVCVNRVEAEQGSEECVLYHHSIHSGMVWISSRRLTIHANCRFGQSMKAMCHMFFNVQKLSYGACGDSADRQLQIVRN